MKKLMITSLVLLLYSPLIFAQDKVKEKDIRGEWKMVINIDYDEMEDDMEDDSWFGSVIAGAMSGVVEDVLEEIDIVMKFMDEGKLKITVHAFGEEEIEYGQWYINHDGQLVIIDNDDKKDNDEVWMKEGRNLVSFQLASSGRLERQQVYLAPL